MDRERKSFPTEVGSGAWALILINEYKQLTRRAWNNTYIQKDVKSGNIYIYPSYQVYALTQTDLFAVDWQIYEIPKAEVIAREQHRADFFIYVLYYPEINSYDFQVAFKLIEPGTPNRKNIIACFPFSKSFKTGEGL